MEPVNSHILVGLEYLQLLLGQGCRRPDSSRFIIFSMVGAGGLVLSLWLLYLLLSFGKMQFLTAQAITTFVAMTANFFLNNSMTIGPTTAGARLWIGLITLLRCMLCRRSGQPPGSGVYQGRRFLRYLAAACGLSVGAVWNYAVTSMNYLRQVRELQSGGIAASQGAS